MVVFEKSRVLGHDGESLALSKSTIQRQGRKLRQETSSRIIEEFKPNAALTVHRKQMLDLVGMEKVDWLPNLVTIMGQTKIMDIPKIPAVTISLTN